jgi:hypothetical protein
MIGVIVAAILIVCCVVVPMVALHKVYGPKRREQRWTCIQPGCVAEALPKGGKPPGSPFCPDHGWDTYRTELR